MPPDIEIARRASLLPVFQIAKRRLGIDEQHLESYGRYKAKLSLEYIASLPQQASGRLVLVTAISPTPAGEGKTTTTIGLGDALNRIGHKALICLREPSIGPVFGLKGGATGGGRSQVAPMEDINLHFTGDFAAIAAANNLLAALIDNHIHHGNALRIDPRRVGWKRVVDINDRALREVVIALGGVANGNPREDGFDIVVASEVMAILCLATSRRDLKERLARIVIGYDVDDRPLTASDLKAHGAMAVLLKDALKPNLVQTLENNPALIHGGPFANIAHGCNSVIATRTALRLADYVVTEAGFGADLGAEKFIDIKCRISGLRPDAAVIVATLRALKFHGGVPLADLNTPDLEALGRGIANLERHVDNVRRHYGLPCVVALNSFAHDTEPELDLLRRRMQPLQTQVIVARHWAEGGAGAEDLARAVVELVEGARTRANKNGAGNGSLPVAEGDGELAAGVRFLYEDSATLADKVRAVATRIYGAADVSFDARVKRDLARLERDGHGHLPVCVAKTQYSFSTDPHLKGAPSGHIVNVREVRLAAGAGFIVMICGDVLTMPGLPKVAAAERMDLDDNGLVIGLS